MYLFVQDSERLQLNSAVYFSDFENITENFIKLYNKLYIMVYVASTFLQNLMHFFTIFNISLNTAHIYLCSFLYLTILGTNMIFILHHKM